MFGGAFNSTPEQLVGHRRHQEKNWNLGPHRFSLSIGFDPYSLGDLGTVTKCLCVTVQL